MADQESNGVQVLVTPPANALFRSVKPSVMLESILGLIKEGLPLNEEDQPQFVEFPTDPSLANNAIVRYSKQFSPSYFFVDLAQTLNKNHTIYAAPINLVYLLCQFSIPPGLHNPAKSTPTTIARHMFPNQDAETGFRAMLPAQNFTGTVLEIAAVGQIATARYRMDFKHNKTDPKSMANSVRNMICYLSDYVDMNYRRLADI